MTNKQFYISLPDSSDVNNAADLFKHALKNILREASGYKVKLNQLYFVNPFSLNQKPDIFVDFDLTDETETKETADLLSNPNRIVANTSFYHDRSTKTLNRLSIDIDKNHTKNDVILVSATVRELEKIQNLHLYDLVYHDYRDDQRSNSSYIAVYYDTVD